MTDLQGAEKRRYVREMFTRISGRYDLMNRLMTFGQDVKWRRAAIEAVGPPAGGRVLDVGTGTGDFLPLVTQMAAGCRSVGVDVNLQMMAEGREKLASAGGQAGFVAGDAMRLPFPDDTFDGTVSGFLLRNVVSISETLAEMQRVTAPGRRVACLEITQPQLPIFRRVYYFYFHHIVPLVGGLITGEPKDYAYLPASLDRFVSADELQALMAEAGLEDVRYRRLMLGTVAIHVGRVGRTSLAC